MKPFNNAEYFTYAYSKLYCYEKNRWRGGKFVGVCPHTKSFFLTDQTDIFFMIYEVIGDRCLRNETFRFGNHWKIWRKNESYPLCDSIGLEFLYTSKDNCNGQDNEMLFSLDEYIRKISLPPIKVIKNKK